jgi:hypothetical protein
LAQDVLDIIPEVVVKALDRQGIINEKAEGIEAKTSQTEFGMKYSELIPVLAKAIQEQQQIIESHSSEIKKLKEIIDQLIIDVEKE